MLSLLLSCASRTPPATEPSCALRLDALSDTTWLFLEHRGDGSVQPTTHYRMRFVADEQGLTLLYNAGSPADMYTYRCEADGESLRCLTPPEPERWCLARIASGEPCTAAWLGEHAPQLSLEVREAAVAAATQTAASAASPERFRLMHNNLGNKLRMEVEVEVDATRCRLVVSDLYQTHYNGRWVTDANPAGVNPFVASTEPLLWQPCQDTSALVAVSQPDRTEHEREQTAGEPFFFRYLPEEPLSADCTVNYTLWHNARPVQQGMHEGADLQLPWTLQAPSQPHHYEVFHLQTEAVCPEQTAESLSCTAVQGTR